MGNCAGKISKKDRVPKDQQVQNQPVVAEKATKTTPTTTTNTTTSNNNSTVHVSHDPSVSAPGGANTKPTTTTTTTTTTTPQPKADKGSSSNENTASNSISSTKTTIKTVDGNKVGVIHVNKELHKYIIGTKGATVKEIKQNSGASNIEVGSNGGDEVKVTATTEEQCHSAIEMIQNTVSQHKTSEQRDKEYNEMRDGHEKETQRTEAMYKKYQDQVDALASKREKLNEEANQAYESGDKEKAKQLREESKQQTALMEEVNKKASREIFADKNKGNDKFTVDLHGLKTKEALELLDEHMNNLKKDSSNNGKKFTIITGAGNHSDNGPLIKPLIHKTMNERNITFTEVNNGSIECTL